MRTVTVVTDKPKTITDSITSQLQVGVTHVRAEGMYQHQTHGLLYITISRARWGQIRDVISKADPDAFMVIGQSHVAYGGGFRPMPRQRTLPVNMAA